MTNPTFNSIELNKYVGGIVRGSMSRNGEGTQIMLIISKEQDKAIELIVNIQNGEIESAQEVSLKKPDPKDSKIIEIESLKKRRNKNVR